MFKLKLNFFLQMDLVRMTNNQGSKDRWGTRNCSNSCLFVHPHLCIPLNSIRSPAGQMSQKKEKWVAISLHIGFDKNGWRFLSTWVPHLDHFSLFWNQLWLLSIAHCLWRLKIGWQPLTIMTRANSITIALMIAQSNLTLKRSQWAPHFTGVMASKIFTEIYLPYPWHFATLVMVGGG